MNWTNYLINFFILLPAFGFIVSLLIKDKRENEKYFAFITEILFLVSLLLNIVFIGYWAFNGFKHINLKEISLYKVDDYEFLIDWYYDEITAVYLVVGAIITFVIGKYSSYYMHREEGYKRFFATIFFFSLGYNLTILSGNFETLFMGWEILGITSFLLIAFYRNRYLPVRNAVRVFSVYRIGDVAILIAMWASHHLWHENIAFYKLNSYDLVHEHLSSHTWVGVFIAVALLIAASAKSAQFPFSSWLARAMEGPTPSSAIFYGSLSVHLGLFLMLRTFSFWENQFSVRVLIALWGLVTAFVSGSIVRVQSNIKSKIAYASVTQIGIMFIELALGLKYLVLFHFAGNAFLRTYQLLVSPSIVSYLLRNQFYNYKPTVTIEEKDYAKKIKYSLYHTSLKEFYLDIIQSKFLFQPIKNLGRYLGSFNMRNILYVFVPLYLIALYIRFHQSYASRDILETFPFLFSFIGLLMVVRAFTEKHQPQLAWTLVFFNHFWVSLSISFNENFGWEEIAVYLSGVIVFGIIGYYLLYKLKTLEPNYFSLHQHYGHVYEHKTLANAFFIACLGLMGFPITYTFIGEDLIYRHIKINQYYLAFFNASSYIISGITLIRMYARLFLGNHVKNYHPNPIRTA